jgi:MurNAc alpha-1-phosphate uridylyltransferase
VNISRGDNQRKEGSPAALILAAGEGSRLKPLTDLLPKALCPVNNEPLLDRVLRQTGLVTDAIAVNVHAHPGKMIQHLNRWSGVRVSNEDPLPLGTGGAIGNLREWIDGRSLLVHNSDVWHQADLVNDLLDGWDGVRMRLLVVSSREKSDFGTWTYAGVCLLPWSEIRKLPASPVGLYEALWRDAEPRLDLVRYDGPWFDCGTPSSYLAANLYASGGRSVFGEGAVVRGEVSRSVVWSNGVVRSGESLVEVIRAKETVTVDAPQAGLHSRGASAGRD